MRLCRHLGRACCVRKAPRRKGALRLGQLSERLFHAGTLFFLRCFGELRVGFDDCAKLDLGFIRTQGLIEYDIEECPLGTATCCDFFLVRAHRPHEEFTLRSEEHIATNAGACHQHDEGDICVSLGHDGRNDAALAVADEANRADVWTLGEKGDASFDITSKIKGGGGAWCWPCRRAANAAIVYAEYRDTAAGEVVRNDPERLVLKDLLVAVLAT